MHAGKLGKFYRAENAKVAKDKPLIFADQRRLERFQLNYSRVPSTARQAARFWSAAGSGAPRRFRPHGNRPNFREPLARAKAPSPLRSAGAVQKRHRAKRRYGWGIFNPL